MNRIHTLNYYETFRDNCVKYDCFAKEKEIMYLLNS